MNDDPGRMLRPHRAPPGLLTRARARGGRPPMAPTARSRWALAAVFLLGVALGAVGRDAGTRSAAPPPVDAPTAANAADRVPLHLELDAPGAHTVAVAGTWNAWKTEPLQAGEGGSYQLLVSLPHGRYEYMFLVDGREWIPDPRAAVTRDDGFGGRNSVLEI